MKKIFLILLLLVMPLQMSWAAASAYCQHEEEKTAQRHLGHHGHEHKAKSDQPPAKKDSGQPHSDCNFCHGIGQATFPITTSLPVLNPGSAAVAPCPFFYASHIPDGPKRPDWRSVA